MIRPPALLVLSLPLLICVILRNESSVQACVILPPYDDIAIVKVVFSHPMQAQNVRKALLGICDLKLLDPEREFSDSTDIFLLTSAQRQYLRTVLSEKAITELVSDLGVSIRQEAAEIAAYPRHRRMGHMSPLAVSSKIATVNENFYAKFHVYDDLVDHWLYLNKSLPSLRLQSIGESVEKRPIYAIRIGRTNNVKPIRVLFNGLQHSREWVSTMAPLYAAERFAAAAMKRGNKLAAYLNNVEVIIVPMVNPDGYIYTHTSDRLWRKNRQRETCQIGSRFFPNAGIDLNRNWGVDFGGNKSTSFDSCANTYCGKSAFSAPETAAIRNFVLNTPGIVAHIDIHSYSQLVIGPWLYTNSTPRNAKKMRLLGNELARDLSSGETLYKYTRMPKNNMYYASGTMTDWFFSNDITSFTFELRPDRYSSLGFELNKDQILPTCKEVFKALSKVVEYSYSPTPKMLEAGGVSYRLGSMVGYAAGGAAVGVFVLALAISFGCMIVRRRQCQTEDKSEVENQVKQ